MSNNGIIYSVISRGTVVLAEYSNSSGNFPAITQHILEKIPEGNSKLTYVYDNYLFHYISSDGIIYLAMADDNFGRRIPFTFLEDIKNEFEARYGERALTEVSYGLNEFSKVLAERMQYYNENPSAVDKVQQVKGEIEQVKDVMVHNIEKVLERGERIEILVDKTDNLNQQSFAFKKRSTALKRQMWWKNTKLMVILIIVVLCILYFIYYSLSK